MGGAGQPKDFCDVCGKHTGGGDCSSHSVQEKPKQKRVKKEKPKKINLDAIMQATVNNFSMIVLDMAKLGIQLHGIESGKEKEGIAAIRELADKFANMAVDFRIIASEVERDL